MIARKNFHIAPDAGQLLIAVALMIAAAWMTIHYTFAIFQIDNDILVPIEIWEGVRQHGIRFVSSWNYTRDNWILSLVPLWGLIYEIFGFSIGLPILVGWLIFIASVLTAGVIAKSLCGWRPAIAMMLVLSFPNVLALGEAGFLAHPVSHNISMLWVLIALLLAMTGIERRRLGWNLWSALCVFIASISDPWASPALSIPLILVTGGLLAYHRAAPERRAIAVQFFATICALVMAVTHLFGLFSFLPENHIGRTDLWGMVLNIGWALLSLGAIYNVVPGVDPTSYAMVFINIAALTAVLAWTLVRTLAKARDLSMSHQFVAGVCVLSVVVTSLLFPIGYWGVPTIYLGRFFVNVYFFGAIAVTAIVARERPGWKWARGAIAAYGCLLIVAGVASRPSAWIGGLRGADLVTEHRLAAILSRNGLHYGFGPYWGSNAFSLGVASGGRITVRPVAFESGRVKRRFAETSTYWFRPGDEPAPGIDRFLLIKDDGEECPSVPRCVRAAEAQLGRPARRLVVDAYTILVWDRPIVARIDP